LSLELLSIDGSYVKHFCRTVSQREYPNEELTRKAHKQQLNANFTESIIGQTMCIGSNRMDYGEPRRENRSATYVPHLAWHPFHPNFRIC